MAPDESDERLARRAQSGDQQAFGELVTRYTAPVYNLIYRFVQDRGEAENLTQETFIRIWKALPRLKLDRPLRPYLMRIAVNQCRTWAQQRRTKWAFPIEPESSAAESDKDVNDLIDRLNEEELRTRLASAIAQLPPLYQTVLTLRYDQELAYEEIAEALQLPLNTVRTHLHRAKGRLREILKEGTP